MSFPQAWDSSDAWCHVGNSSWSCVPARSLPGSAILACAPAVLASSNVGVCEYMAACQHFL
jgi:hypothetical protein